MFKNKNLQNNVKGIFKKEDEIKEEEESESEEE